MLHMRTTVTIEVDIGNRLREEMQRNRIGFKQALNEALRRGLRRDSDSNDRPDFQVNGKKMGMRTGLDPAQMRDFDDDLEIEEFARKTDKLKQALKKRS